MAGVLGSGSCELSASFSSKWSLWEGASIVGVCILLDVCQGAWKAGYRNSNLSTSLIEI
jgi:hypothetical protein